MSQDDEEEKDQHPPRGGHPLQPVELDQRGIPRFKPNRIVKFLLDAGPYDLNKLACMDFPDEDREQFAQLIGYSVGGFSELSYVSDQAYDEAEAIANQLRVPKDGSV